MSGVWKKGGMITYTDKEGEGLKGKLVVFNLNSSATLEYTTVLKDFKEAPKLNKGWVGRRVCYELVEKNGVTTLSIETEVPTKKHYDNLSKSWDKALKGIKGLAEKGTQEGTTKIFVNLPVKDLNKSKKFFTTLGFSINSQFTDENAACVVISDTIYVMLLVTKFFKTFTTLKVSDPTKQAGAILALSVASREKVDEKVRLALSAGGKIHKESEDHGWMYGKSIEDVDGHLWEIFWMDPSKIN